MTALLPDVDIMYEALVSRDSRFDGIFFAAISSTGIFCRPTCTARKPQKKNVEFFATTRQALLNGYRPCKICKPMEYSGNTPDWLKPVLDELNRHPDIKIKDWNLRELNIDPGRVRRWFNKHHGMTFHAYQRFLRIGKAFGQIKLGDKVIEAAFDSGYQSLSGFTDSFRKTTGFTPNQSPGNNLILITRIPTPLGPMIAGATEDGICLLEFGDRPMLETQLKRLMKRFNAKPVAGISPYFERLADELKEYFSGKRQVFSTPLVLGGTPFQEKVWQVLKNIRYGATHSYKIQAELIGQPQAVRAVARANGDNRIAILIPCHRVIGSDGQLVGYGGGLWRKKYLLDLENQTLSSSK